jgi:acetyl-CoA C-acetyltransferase
MNDGAAALLVMSADRARALGLMPMARIVSYAYAALEPERMGLGPTLAVPRALERAGLRLADVDLLEINEAFAAQYLACQRVLGFDDARTNVNGGAIALGHPIGASGARITVTLLHEMKRRGVRIGVATLCVGGGQGAAMVFEHAG